MAWFLNSVGYKPFEIAGKLKINGPKFSQRKATALKHLRNLLLFSRDFVQTDYFMNSDFQPFPMRLLRKRNRTRKLPNVMQGM